jgi:predicted phosphodiesterase
MLTGYQATQSGHAPVLRGVYGNIDGYDVRSIYPGKLFFTCEEMNVYIQHIGGYPKHYVAGVKLAIINSKSKIFISGHSHILKIMYDNDLQCLHMNPGAAGKQGWHKIRTIIRFAIDGKEIKDCEVIELNPQPLKKL